MQIVYNHERRYLRGDVYAYFENTIGGGGTLGMEIAVNGEMKRSHLMVDVMVLGWD